MQAADTLGISLHVYQQCELGLLRLPVSEIFAVRKLLNISIEDFFTVKVCTFLIWTTISRVQTCPT